MCTVYTYTLLTILILVGCCRGGRGECSSSVSNVNVCASALNVSFRACRVCANKCERREKESRERKRLIFYSLLSRSATPRRRGRGDARRKKNKRQQTRDESSRSSCCILTCAGAAAWTSFITEIEICYSLPFLHEKLYKKWVVALRDLKMPTFYNIHNNRLQKKLSTRSMMAIEPPSP